MRSKKVQPIFIQKMISKAWELSILLILPLLALQGKLSILDVGLLSGLFGAMQMIGGIATVYVSQRFGRYYSLIGSLALYVAGWCLLGLGLNGLWFWVIYAGTGFASGLEESAGTVSVAKLTSTGNRTIAMAKNGVMGDLGRVLASSLSVWLYSVWGISGVSFAAAIVTVVLLGYQTSALRKLAFLLPVAPVSSVIQKQRIAVVDFGLLRNKKYLYSGIAQLIDAFASASLYIFLPLLLASKGFSGEVAGQASLLLFVGYAGGRLLLGGLAKKRGEVFALIAGEVLMAGSFIALLFVYNPWVVGGLLLLAGAATRGTSPVVKAMIADGLEEKDNMDIGIGQLHLAGRVATATNRPFLSFLFSIGGLPFVFVASSLLALTVAIPAYYYEKTK